MSSIVVRSSDILGLTPGIDVRNSDKKFAIGGRNFAFTSLGPRSMFGSRYVLPHALGLPRHAQGLRIRLRSGDRVFHFEGETILEWDEDVGGWQILYITPVTNLDPYRWTSGYLNDKIFFCHPRVGIVVYDLNDNSVYKHEGVGVPSDPIAITVNMGRLIVLDDTYLSWSWQADGMNFLPALGEAGFQKISERVAGFPIMVNNYAQGIITWTTGGMMRSEFTGGQEVYRHRHLNTEFRPINSFCTLQMDDNTSVIFDERGLFSSSGEAPQPLTPLFNEFLIEYVRQNKLTLGDVETRIEWDDLRRHLYLSLSVTPESPMFEKSYVLYPTLDKWGTFDEQHYGIFPVRIDYGDRTGSYFGYCDSEGRVNYWSDFPSREILPADSGILNLRYPLIYKPTFEVEGSGYWVMSSSLILNSDPQEDASGRAGFYAVDSNTVATPEVTGLNSVIQIGLLRPTEYNDSFDRMSEIIGVSIANVESGPEVQFVEDYLQVPDGVDDQDYDAITGAEDYGLNSLAYVNHGLRVISTVDGRSQFDVTIPTLEVFTAGVRHFSCSTVGIWHILELTATDAGEAFYVRVAELNAIDAGRYS